MKVRITAHHRGAWLCDRGPLTLAGSYSDSRPCVGDWVEIRETQIVSLHPRKTLFARRAAGLEVVAQPIAANVDIAFIVMGLDGDFNLRRLERYLVLTNGSGARPVVLLTKSDICTDVENRRLTAGAVAEGIDVHAICAPQGDGLDIVRSYLAAGITSVVLGSSGAGKSTLLNALLGEERMATNTVRESDSRGRHTTTHRELIELPGGAFLIDTPGMRELQLWASEETVVETFTEIEELATSCRFADCRHESEPGCAVREAVEAGLVDPDRLASLHKLRREAQYLARQTDVHVMLEHKAKWKAIHKAMRHYDKRR